MSLKFLHQLVRLIVVTACFNLACFGARAVEPQRVLHSAMALQLESLEITHLADFRQWVMRRLNAESKDGDALNDLHQRLIAALREVNELERAALERAVSLHELVLLWLTKSAQARAGSAADDAAQSINQIQANLARARQMVSSDLKRIENRDAALAQESQSLEVRARRLSRVRVHEASCATHALGSLQQQSCCSRGESSKKRCGLQGGCGRLQPVARAFACTTW